MPRVFISNTKVQETENADIVFNHEDGIEQLQPVDTSGNIIYVIDVHCTFTYNGKLLKQQEQGGVIIYRHLLSKFKDCQEKLKVVFYSPISKDDLVKLRAENYVLKLLPFVECKYDSSFETELSQLINDYENKAASTINNQNSSEGWPQFNNASENLLSGWAIAGEKKIDLKGKKPLIIDDEWQQWKLVYDAIFIGSAEYFLSDFSDIKEEFQKLKTDFFNHVNQTTLENIDFIISDLYLCEAHESELWKNKDYIHQISGYKLLQKIRILSSTLPVVFQTSSNKIMNFRGLLHAGIDGYTVKDIRPDSVKHDKLNNWAFFENNLTSLFEEYGPVWIHQISNDINKIDLDSGYWWLTKLHGNSKIAKQKHLKEIKGLILYSLTYLKQVLFNNYNGLDDSINDSGGVYSIAATCIIGNYGKAIESLFGIENKKITDYWLRFVHKLKAESNHGEHFHLIRISDAIICSILVHKSFISSKILRKSTATDFNVPLAQWDIAKYKFQFDEDGKFFYQHISLPYIDSANKIVELHDDNFNKQILSRLSCHVNSFRNKWPTWTIAQKKYFLKNQSYFTGIHNGTMFSTEDILTTGKVTVS